MLYLLVALIVTAIVMTIAWRRLSAMNAGQPRPGSRPTSRPARPKQVAPDDDPEFLGEIDRKLRGEDKNG